MAGNMEKFHHIVDQINDDKVEMEVEEHADFVLPENVYALLTVLKFFM